MLGMHAYRMGWHANELPGKGRSQQGNDPQRESSLRQWPLRDNLRLRARFSRLRHGLAWPGFGWKCVFRRAHFAPQRRNSTRAGIGPNKLLLFLTFWNCPSTPVRVGPLTSHVEKLMSICGKQRKCLILQHLVMVRKLSHYILWISLPEAQPIWFSNERPFPATSTRLEAPPDCGRFVNLFVDPFRMDLASHRGYF